MISPGAGPAGFRFSITRTGGLSFKLRASQVVPLQQDEAFRFFEDPRNLSHIIPDWVHFHFEDQASNPVVQDNAEFHYTLSWLGIPLQWRSRIIDYHPPERFTDIQTKGPYSSWAHIHTLEPVPEGTLMRDEVSYTIPLIALPVHGLIIKKQLEKIFIYRAVKISEWAESGCIT